MSLRLLAAEIFPPARTQFFYFSLVDETERKLKERLLLQYLSEA